VAAPKYSVETILKAKELAAQGMTQRDIADTLGVDGGSVHRMIHQVLPGEVRVGQARAPALPPLFERYLDRVFPYVKNPPPLPPPLSNAEILAQLRLVFPWGEGSTCFAAPAPR
jgi:hypothetical protein